MKIKPTGPIDGQGFLQLLREGASQLALDLPEDGLQRLVAHWKVLDHWADQTNLTTVRDPRDMAERLYLDSAVLLPQLAGASELHDVGTGAGFPGLVIKGLRPELRVTLTEARRKKVTFLGVAARAMGIGEGLELRWERLGWQEGTIKTCAEVVSRAAFPPKEWLEIGLKLVSPGGRLWLFVGDQQEDANPPVPADLSLESTVEYRLPFCKKSRRLVSYRRI